MHGKPFIDDQGRMDESEGHNAVKPVVTCKCGCGTILQKNKWGRQQVFVPGHQRKSGARTRDQWAVVFDEVKAGAPLCGCGCGEKTRPKSCNTLDQFIRHKGSRAYYKYVQGHGSRSLSWHTKIDDTERKAILGTLLGDSSILYPHKTSGAPRVCFNHGGPQAAWAEHKADFLKRLGGKSTRRENKGFGAITIAGATRCIPDLAEIYQLCVKDGKKTVSRKWLEQIGEIGLAWWFCDDGASCGRGFYLHTEGYSLAENKIICQWFRDRYGAASIRTGKRGYFWIYLSANTQRKILPIIEQYIPECMQYKLASSRACAASTTKRIRL